MKLNGVVVDKECETILNDTLVEIMKYNFMSEITEECDE